MSLFEVILVRIFPRGIAGKMRTRITPNTDSFYAVIHITSKLVRSGLCLHWINRSSCSEMFCKKGVLETFTKFTGTHLCQGLFLIKLQASCSKLTIKTTERHQWRRSCVFIVNFEHDACNFIEKRL